MFGGKIGLPELLILVILALIFVPILVVVFLVGRKLWESGKR